MTVKDASYADRRAAMAEESRRRILEATTVILARGMDELSMPAVAREARVSVPTVYRNFPDKKALLRGTLEHLRRERGYRGPPASLDDLEATLAREYEKAASMNETVRLALGSTQAVQTMHAAGALESRRRENEAMLGAALRALPAEDREHVTRLSMILCSSMGARAFAALTGLAPAEAARTVTWTLRRLLGVEAQKRRRKR